MTPSQESQELARTASIKDLAAAVAEQSERVEAASTAHQIARNAETNASNKLREEKTRLDVFRDALAMKLEWL